jgi:exodeoxyribonuclease V alpha subunit
MSNPELEWLEGSVERITYYSEETGYTVIRLLPAQPLKAWADTNREGLVTVVGELPEISPGETLRLGGRWATHSTYGRQFKAEQCEQVLPANVEGIRRYLGSGLIKGIGPVSAERIVDAFGEETLAVIDESPGRLYDVPGIGQKRVRLIREAWDEQRHIRQIMVFLQSHGISTRLAVKIFKQYGDEAVARVQQDPYQLARDIWGIGFRTADKIARDLGLPPDAPQRIEAGLVYTLNQMTNDGHVYAPRNILSEEAAQLLEAPPEAVQDGIDRLLMEEALVQGALSSNGEPSIYLVGLYYTEVGVSRKIIGMIAHPVSRLGDLRAGELPSLGGEGLSERQLAAVQAALANKVSVLTGGPGTGKTTALRALINVLTSAGHTFALASPTGRAAKRLTEATGHPAKTIHRMLGYSFAEGFSHDPDNTLDVDMVVVDEASMLDQSLTHNLLKATEPATHLLLVGDVDQLPSVGAGDVLRDLIASGVAPVTRLDKIFRQAESSLIVRNAHRVNRGEQPLTPENAEDFFLFTKEDPDEAAELLVDVVQNRIPRKFGLNPLDDIQVLSPMHRGAVGVTALNHALQAALNPPSPRLAERWIGGRQFRAGDRVMQTRNNYDKDVFNGDIGRVTGIDLVAGQLEVDFDQRPVHYDWSEADELAHAYCISTHKSQGSEYTAIVMPVMMQHYVMLQRNLLYTAISRARRLAVLVGTRKAIGIAVRNDKVARRYTALAERLQAEMGLLS